VKKHKRKTKRYDGTVDAAKIQASATIKAAWIGFWAVVIVALIGAFASILLQ
jgi:hypothetical protein